MISQSPSDNYLNQNVWREYMPHALRLLQDERTVSLEGRYDLSRRVGLCLQADGRIADSVARLEETYRWRKLHLPENDLSRLASQHELAIAYKANGQVKEAVWLLKQVVKIESAMAEDGPSRFVSQHILAVAYQANGQVKEAVALLEQVIKIRSQTLAEDYPSRLISELALARLVSNE
ncbi:hypothetical protein BKA67DRAFT_214414 [Truncatella angustata]|uniref:MalT-like TPR region domain-containing protein n=1 Tax=Truncatella angustata TaxID=152316 RepID=A0A9P9A301_9PEZI|nr:uncharacterized protein BKA67DRAFT_214414 [Truncatella angustata]KAH6658445.1 hypothetical protein BKA67DRAFT_214414 [Truncatella angustata]